LARALQLRDDQSGEKWASGVPVACPEQFVESRWSSLYVGDFLRSWAAWLQDGCISEGAPFTDDVEPPTWQSLALQIHGAHTYE
jgi:hypothetical protein